MQEFYCIDMIIGYTSPSGKSYIGQTTNEEFESVKDAAISVGANETNIAKCCRGECKSIKNFKWKYKEE